MGRPRLTAMTLLILGTHARISAMNRKPPERLLLLLDREHYAARRIIRLHDGIGNLIS